MKKMRKSLSILITALLLLTLLPTVALAAAPVFSSKPYIEHANTVITSHTFIASGTGTTFSIAEPLPAGVTFDSVGELSAASGMADGVYLFTVTASNSDGTATQRFALVVGSKKLVVSESNFSNNSVTGNGGAISNDPTGGGVVLGDFSSVFLMRNSTLRNNNAANCGGGVYISNCAAAVFMDSVFEGNTAGGDGGAVCIVESSTNVLFENCTFNGNSAGGLGSAVYIKGDATFIDCVFGEFDVVYVEGTVTSNAAAPAITSISPTDNASQVPIGTTDLQIFFSERVTPVAGKLVTVTVDGQTIDIASDTATMSPNGKTATLSLPSLGYGKTYSVSVETGAFISMMQKYTAGYIGTFSTESQPNYGSDPTYYERTLMDPPTGVAVSGQMTGSATLTVRNQGLHAAGTCAACDEIRARQAAGELIILYDISVNGDYTGSLEVSIPVDAKYNGQTVTILHCRNGVLESINVTVANGMAKGMFTSLSPFAVVQARGGAISGLPDAYTLLVGQSVSWTPSPADGAWSYDSDYLTMSESGGIYTFTAQRVGRTVATYTADGVSHSVNITINGATIPQTGDVSNPLPFLLLALASLCGMGALALYRKKSRA